MAPLRTRSATTTAPHVGTEGASRARRTPAGSVTGVTCRQDYPAAMTWTRLVTTLVGLLCALLLLVTLGPAAQASHARTAYGERAGTVAAWGDCKNVRNRSNGGRYALSGVVCDLRGHRVNILTFSTKRQEVVWVALTCVFLPDQWLMLGPGFVVTAKDGNRAAAVAGKHAYGYRAYQCKLLA